MIKDTDAQILEELHKDEEEIKKEEKRVKIISSAALALILILFAGVFYLFLNPHNKSIVQTIVKVIPPSVSISPSPAVSPVLSIPDNSSPTSSPKSAKDYYINIGSGTNQSTDWADVPGALTTADIAGYSNIKEVHLETNIDVPSANGTVSVRLFNKTDNYAVWNSERTVDSQAVGDLLISQDIIYDKGPKLYQIQMKSQLGVVANLVQSRVHIITQ